MKVKPRIRLIHWNREEGAERAGALEAAGYKVQFDDADGPELLRRLKEDSPLAVVIDLTRVPSQGREVGIALRHRKATRRLPLVFVGGEPEKVSRIRGLLPDAFYTEWSRVRRDLRRAIAHPPALPSVPKSVFEAYRGVPLAKKLGIKANCRVGLANAPDGFADLLGELPEGVRLIDMPRGGCDLLLWFARSGVELKRDLPRMCALAGEAPMWIAWPKKSAGEATDLNQQRVRAAGLAAGLVDYKICAIDAAWAGLLFRRRR